MTARPSIEIPKDPLSRFCALYHVLLDGRPWWRDSGQLRYAALALTSLNGDPTALAARLETLRVELVKDTPWYQRSPVETLLLAALLRHGSEPRAFLDELARAKGLLKAHFRFRDAVFEALAIELMRVASPDGRVSAEQVARMIAVYARMKQDHPWLTQQTDWPACVLLAQTGASPEAIGARLEAIFQALRAHGFGRSDRLQAAAQALYFHREEPTALARRFQRLYAEFRASGLWMNSEDYDEVSILCFSPDGPAECIARVLRHRERILTLPRNPGKQTGFTLACGTALLEALGEGGEAALLTEVQLLWSIEAVIAAQRAAAAAAS